MKGGADLDVRHADLAFILCYFISGLLDSSTYNAWSCFVSMQTGNTVFLGLGASGQPTGKHFGWLKSLISIVSFLLGSLIFSLCSRHRTQKRVTLVVSFTAQTLCILIAAMLIETGAIVQETDVIDHRFFLQLIPLFLLAFQAGGQMAASRGLGFNELPTTVLTSVYYDIMSDPNLVSGISENVKRNRRIAAVVLFTCGAIAGGWIHKANGSMNIVLWLAGGLKAGVTVAWVVWRGAKTLG